MENNEYEISYAIAKTEVTPYADHGLVTLRLIRFPEKAGDALVQGVLHRMRPEHVDDLIAALQSAVDQVRKASGNPLLSSGPPGPRH